MCPASAPPIMLLARFQWPASETLGWVQAVSVCRMCYRISVQGSVSLHLCPCCCHRGPAGKNNLQAELGRFCQVIASTVSQTPGFDNEPQLIRCV
jgi:hypothetical protein